jgi:hypothetical protein
VAGVRVLVALTKVDEYDPSVAASLPRVFSSALVCTLISQVGPLRLRFARLDVQAAVECGARPSAHDLHPRCNQWARFTIYAVGLSAQRRTSQSAAAVTFVNL